MFFNDRDNYRPHVSPLDDHDTTSEAAKEVPPTRYSGSGEHRNPPRVMKIEEIVQWDMNFGVTVGPAGYDHRLRCPYCGKRLLLLFHEGGRDRSGMRIAYRCEHCNAHSLVQFTPPGQKPEFPEASYGERTVVAKPTPVPNTDVDRNERNEKTERTANSSGSRQSAGSRASSDRQTSERSSKRERDKTDKAEKTEKTDRAERNSRNGQTARNNGGPMQRGQQRNAAPSTEQNETLTDAQTVERNLGRNDSRSDLRSSSRSETRSEARNDLRTPSSRNDSRNETRSTSRNGSRNEPRSTAKDALRDVVRSEDNNPEEEKLLEKQQRTSSSSARTVSQTQTHTKDKTSPIDEISEVLQEQADKTPTRSKPYQRRRRRPFRPPIKSSNNNN